MPTAGSDERSPPSTREGADIAIVYLLEDDDAAETKRIVETEGRKAITIRGDIGERAFADEIVARTLEAFGRIDIVVNNAGEQHPEKDITDISEDQLRRTFQTNIFGMFFLVQAVRPYLKGGAAIVNCTSVTMYQGCQPARKVDPLSVPNIDPLFVSAGGYPGSP